MRIAACHSQFRFSSATQKKLQIPNSGPFRLLRPDCPQTHQPKSSLLFPWYQAPASLCCEHLPQLCKLITLAEASLPILRETLPARSLYPDLSPGFSEPGPSFLHLGGFPLPLRIPLWGRDSTLSTGRAPSTAGCWKYRWMGDFPGGPKVKTLPSSAGASGSIPGQGAEQRPPHDLKPKNQNIKQSNEFKTF